MSMESPTCFAPRYRVTILRNCQGIERYESSFWLLFLSRKSNPPEAPRPPEAVRTTKHTPPLAPAANGGYYPLIGLSIGPYLILLDLPFT